MHDTHANHNADLDARQQKEVRRFHPVTHIGTSA